MKKFALLLASALLVLALGGCAAADVSGYTEYNGVQIPNADIENMRNMYTLIGAAYMPADEELLEVLAWNQVQVDEAERLGLMPSEAAAEADYQEQLVKPVMQFLASDDPMMHEQALFFLMMWQEQQEQLGMSHDEYCDFLISSWQKDMGMNALYQHFLSENGLAPYDMWASNWYSGYVEDLLAQAANGEA